MVLVLCVNFTKNSFLKTRIDYHQRSPIIIIARTTTTTTTHSLSCAPGVLVPGVAKK